MTKLRSPQNFLAGILISLLMLCALAILPIANAAAAKLLVSWKNPVYSGRSLIVSL